MRIAHRTLALFAAVAVLPGLAVAAEEARPTTLTADFGYVKTGGNTEVTTVTGADKLERRASPWLFTQEAGAVWGENNGVESAGRYSFGLRADRSFNERLSAYGLATWMRNTFAGVSRQFDQGVGLTWHAVTAKPNLLDLEAGFGLIQRRTTLEQDENFSTARAGALYSFEFSEKSNFEAKGAYVLNLEDSEDSQGDARFSLTAPVAGRLAMKVSYDFLYRNRPLPGLEKLDTTFSVGVQASF